MGKPRNTRHTRKYPKYPEKPESKKDTRKYPIVFFDTTTRPEPDPLPGILSTTRPDPILKNPTRWALAAGHASTYLLFPLRIGQFFTFLLPGISAFHYYKKKLQNVLWQNTAV